MKYRVLLLIFLISSCDKSNRDFYSFDFSYSDNIIIPAKETPGLIESKGNYFLNDTRAENLLVLVSQKIVTYQSRDIKVSKYSTNRLALDSNLLVYVSENGEILLVKSSIWNSGVVLGLNSKEEVVGMISSFDSM